MAEEPNWSWFRNLRLPDLTLEGSPQLVDPEDLSELEQGDVLDDVVCWRFDPSQDWQNAERWTSEEDPLQTSPVPQSYRARVIVVDQSCDLTTKKLDLGPSAMTGELSAYVNVCIVQDQEAFIKDVDGNRPLILESIRIGQHKRYFMLKGSALSPAFPQSIVDLYEVYQIPHEFLRSHASGYKDRLRLKAPMRENLGAAFGSRFMRVAIDNGYEIKSFLTAEVKSFEAKVRENFRQFSRENRDNPDAVADLVGDLAQNPAYQARLKTGREAKKAASQNQNAAQGGGTV